MCELSLGETAEGAAALGALASSSSRAPGASWQTAALHRASGADDGVLLASVDKLLLAAAVLGQRGRWKRSAALMQQAYSLASERAVAGVLVGRVACAGIAIQYCTLLSRLGNHDLALKEAFAAAQESEEVWDILTGAEWDLHRSRAARMHMSSELRGKLAIVLADPPNWIERAVAVHVQVRQCLALELECCAAAGHFDELTAAAVHELSLAFQEEACTLAGQLLSDGHSVRDLTERTLYQAVARRGGGSTLGASDTFSISQRPSSAPTVSVHRSPARPAVAADSMGLSPPVLQRPKSAHTASLQRSASSSALPCRPSSGSPCRPIPRAGQVVRPASAACLRGADKREGLSSSHMRAAAPRPASALPPQKLEKASWQVHSQTDKQSQDMRLLGKTLQASIHKTSVQIGVIGERADLPRVLSRPATASSSPCRQIGSDWAERCLAEVARRQHGWQSSD